MRLHSLEHVSFEALAAIGDWAKGKNISTSSTKLFSGQKLPHPDDFDFLCIMGGPMNIYQEDQYPWLKAEKEFISAAIEAGKIVVGICLGAQLIADCLGGKITKNEFGEIGWNKIQLTVQARNMSQFKHLPAVMEVFQWHGDTFSLPDNAISIASSEGCVNQGFVYAGKVYAFQFHIEYDRQSIETMIEKCPEDFTSGGRYIQSATQMLENAEQRCQRNIDSLKVFLDTITKTSP